MTDRQTRLDERRAAILAAARTSADSSGWSAVTTRRLAEAIGYSQPVLYGHFPGGKAEIMRTVALD
ncbi:TetR family transcriptional regulator, partial [Burkholderia multivorans]